MLVIFQCSFLLPDLANNLTSLQNELSDAASKLKRSRDVLEEIKRKLNLLPSGIIYYYIKTIVACICYHLLSCIVIEGNIFTAYEQPNVSCKLFFLNVHQSVFKY